MRELLREVLDLQANWSNVNTPPMQRRGILIRTEILSWIRPHLGAFSTLMGPSGTDLDVEGRDETGQKSEIPWVRIHSTSHSPSANEGWYCVYLFRTDGTGVYLCLEHASTRYQDGDFKPRSAEELASLVKWARNALGSLLTERSDLSTDIELSGKGRLSPVYEQGTVCCKFYDVMDLPDEVKMVRDLTTFTGLLVRQESWRDPAGGRPVRVGRSGRPVVSVA